MLLGLYLMTKVSLLLLTYSWISNVSGVLAASGASYLYVRLSTWTMVHKILKILYILFQTICNCVNTWMSARGTMSSNCFLWNVQQDLGHWTDTWLARNTAEYTNIIHTTMTEQSRMIHGRLCIPLLICK